MRILIVEDEVSLAELVANRLKKEKYTVDISNDGDPIKLGDEEKTFERFYRDDKTTFKIIF